MWLFNKWLVLIIATLFLTSGWMPPADYFLRMAQVAFMFGETTLEHYYLQQAALRGHPYAQLYFAERQPDQAKLYLLRAAKQLPEAYYPLALIYAEEGDWSAAHQWCHRAAVAGDRRAQYHLGRWLAEGRGVSRDLETALQWFHCAADQNDADAQWAMGEAALGRGGFPKDERAAFQWFQRAAERHHLLAQKRLAECYRDGIGTSQNLPLAEYWFQRSKE